MSSYITMDCCQFPSPLSIEEIRERYKAEFGGETFSENYEFELLCATDSSYYELIPYSGNYGEIRDDPDELLRIFKFISTIISVSGSANVELEDSYHEKWGHLIFYTSPFEKGLDDYQVFDITYEPTVKGLPIDKFSGDYRKERAVFNAQKGDKES